MIKDFIIKIQNSNEAIKKLWLFVFSGISMAVVVGLWMVYLNTIVAKVESPKQIVSAPAAAPAYQEPGLLEIFGAGVKVIFDQFKEKLAVTNNIFIKNPEINFIAEGVEQIPATSLR